MTNICIFWVFIVAISAVVFVATGSRWEKPLHLLYRPLVLVGFSMAVLSGVRNYLHVVLAGNTDAAIGLDYFQALINPVVHGALAIGGGWAAQFVESPLWGAPSLHLMGCPADSIAYALWWVMVADLFFGNLFWFIASSGWLSLAKRTKINGPTTPEHTAQV